MASNQQVVVPVVSAWNSRVNWIGGFLALAVPLTALLPVVPEKYKPYVLAAIGFIGGIGVVYQRTFQTTSVTPSSVPTTTPTYNTIVTAARNAGASEEAITDLLNSASRVNP